MVGPSRGPDQRSSPRRFLLRNRLARHFDERDGKTTRLLTAALVSLLGLPSAGPSGRGVLGQPMSQRQAGENGVDRAYGRKDRLIATVSVGDVVEAAEWIGHRGGTLGSTVRGSGRRGHQVAPAIRREESPRGRAGARSGGGRLPRVPHDRLRPSASRRRSRGARTGPGDRPGRRRSGRPTGRLR